jgi:hypothetical protein
MSPPRPLAIAILWTPVRLLAYSSNDNRRSGAQGTGQHRNLNSAFLVERPANN